MCSSVGLPRQQVNILFNHKHQKLNPNTKDNIFRKKEQSFTTCDIAIVNQVIE